MTSLGKPTKKTKGSYQHGTLKESLMKAAFASIKKNREVDFSLRELAKSVGVTPMAAYRHFESKEAILMEIAKEGFEKLGHSFEAVLKQDPTNLQALGIAYIEFAAENPVYFRVMFHPDLNHNKKNEQRPEDRKAYQLLLDCVSANQKLGRFKHKEKYSDTESLAITAWSAVHGLSSLIVNGNLDPKVATDPKSIKQMIEHTTLLVIKGLEN